MAKMKLSLSTLKLALPLIVVAFGLFALGSSLTAISGAFLTAFAEASNGLIQTAVLPSPSPSPTPSVINGLKYQDDNSNGQYDPGEAGLEGWHIVATTKIWESQVQALNTPAVVSPTLANGTNYIARVTGTYDANDSITSDAKYSFRSINSTSWTDSVKNYEGYGPTLLDLQIDGVSPNWGAYNADHVYWIPLTGDGNTRSFEIYDLDNGNNDSGALTVELFEVVAETDTIANGTYSLDISGHENDTLYLFEILQNGWTQTEPGQIEYYHLSEPSDRLREFNFGNKQSTAQGPSTSDVTVCKVDTNQQPLSDWRMVLHQPNALETKRVYPSNANGSTGGNTNSVVNSSSGLATDDYVWIANGSYTYRGTPGAEYSDAGYSKRAPSDPVYGGAFVPWVNVATFPMPNTGWLGVRVNGTSTNWSPAFNPAHIYALGYPDYAGGQFSFTILDDIYSDNSGYIDATLYRGWAQDTAGNGCTTFTDVPYGSYTLEEIGQYGWQYESGDQGTVVVDAATESFTLVNESTNTNVAPISSMTVSSSPTKLIENRVKNGGFENGLNDWKHVGDVQVADVSELGTVNSNKLGGPSPFGEKIVRIGRMTNPGKNVDVNILSQDVSNAGQGLRSVGFWYNFKTYEPGNGFDEPAFMVFVGDKMVHQVWASDVITDNDGTTLDQSGWKFLSVDLTDTTDQTLSIAFYGGNSGDANYQSYVYVDNVTTNEAAVNEHAVFELSAIDNGSIAETHYRYFTDGVETHGTGGSSVTFSLSAQPDDGKIEYWSVDNQGLAEAPKTFHVMFDDEAPATISDLSVNDEGDGVYTLTWTAPDDVNPYNIDQAADYDVRYNGSQAAVTEGGWDALAKPIVLNSDGLTGGGLRAPLKAGNTEVVKVKVEGPASEYWFSVRSADRARNQSGLSPVVSSGTVVTPGDQHAQDVVINEIMWSGSAGAPADEWIELRNMTDKAINLNGWKIEGLANGSNTLTLGSGTLPASGYFIISNFNQAGSASKVTPQYVDSSVELSNAGEQLTLKTAADQVIDQTPAGSGWAAGSNGAQKRSMERNNQPGDGTLTDNWHTCDSDSCAEARIWYWDSVGDNYGTPGDANLSFDDTQIVTKVIVKPASENHIKIHALGVQLYSTMSYNIEYVHPVDGQDVPEALAGETTFAAQSRAIASEELFLGTCSTGQESCVPHVGATQLKTTLTFKGDGVPDRTIVIMGITE